MTALTSDRFLIDLDDVDFRSAVSEAIMKKIGSSINWGESSKGLSLGSLIWSQLDLTDFQNQYGSDWVLADGTSITGSDLDTLTGISTAPDLIDKYSRGLDNSRGVDSGRAIATTQSSQLKEHGHLIYTNETNNTNGSGLVTLPFASKYYTNTAGTTAITINGTTNVNTQIEATLGSQGTVARMKAVAMYPYIRINE